MSNILILDGAVGTQLEEYGLSLTLPVWSADANIKSPDIVTKIHKEYIRMGSDVITTNTFRSTPWTFRKAGYSNFKAQNYAKESFFRAIDCAREASNDQVQIAGAITSLEDCYQPDQYPGKTAAEDTYGQLLEWFYEGGIKIVLFETMGNVKELKIALNMASSSFFSIWVSLIMQNEENILDGTPLSDIVKLKQFKIVEYLLTNCNNTDITIRALKNIRSLWKGKIGAYPNLGIKEFENSFHDLIDKSNFRSDMKAILDVNPNIIGACCGSKPEHINILKTLING
ncbi:MAG: homocysteine S-methyltransferase family protein [Fidelibacterota bacterium]|jgi:homocysteine S-methyltransferase|tara:strand:+ start:320 stop:1174 length:855 start_codon:yes stop_codon:yes gene_type:complete